MTELEPEPHGTSSIHSVKDLLIHVGTIFLGLLLALGLNSLVEWNHHRKELKETREALAEEREQNVEVFRKNRAAYDAAEPLVKEFIVKLRDAMAHNKPLDVAFTPDPPYRVFATAAWKTAQRTGALSLMHPHEVQKYDERYNSYQLCDEQSIIIYRIIDRMHGIFLADPDPSHITHDQEVQLDNDAIELEGELYEMRVIMRVHEELDHGAQPGEKLGQSSSEEHSEPSHR